MSLLPPLERSGSSVALRFPDGTLDYHELRGGATRLAREIAGARRVAVIAEPTLETCVAVVAGLLAGVPVVPINPRAGAREREHILRDSEPDAVLGGELELELGRAGALPPEPNPEAPALIVYTSGTTGPPKGALLPRRAIASNLDALADAWAWTERDVVTHALPLFHVHGLVLGVLGPLRRGGAVHHLGRFSPAAVAEAFNDGATVMFGVPTMYRRLADAGDRTVVEALAKARILVSGSAPLAAADQERLESLTGQQVLERYGLTETLINTAVRADGDRRPGYVGPPLAGVELRLVDDDGTPIEACDDETIGEVDVRGPNLFLGYLNRPGATRAAFRDGWFRTGDLATRSPDGYLRIVGRRSTDLINSGGYKIGAGEVEAALREHAAVHDAAVTAELDPDLGERVVAWVVLRAGATASEDDLVAHTASVLAPHKRPRIVHVVDDLPRNEMGKVQKRRLTGRPTS